MHTTTAAKRASATPFATSLACAVTQNVNHLTKTIYHISHNSRKKSHRTSSITVASGPIGTIVWLHAHQLQAHAHVHVHIHVVGAYVLLW